MIAHNLFTIISQNKLYFWGYYLHDDMSRYPQPTEICSDKFTQVYKISIMNGRFVILTDNGIMISQVRNHITFTKIDFPHITSIIDIKCNLNKIYLLTKDNDTFNLYICNDYTRFFLFNEII